MTNPINWKCAQANLLLLMLCAAAVLQSPLVHAQSEDIAVLDRKIYVPFDDLQLLLADNSDRVLLTDEEYQSLLAAAETEEIQRAPSDLVIVDADYRGVVQAGIARIEGRIIVEPLNDGWVQVPLSLSGVALRSATLDGVPARIWRDPQNQLTLLTSGAAPQTLELSMMVPLETSAARQSMHLQLPAPSATRFQLTVPGNVELKSGAAVAQRTHDVAADQTRFDLIVDKAPMNLVMTLNNRLLKDEQIVVANSVLIHKLTPQNRELHVTTSMDLIHGAVEQMRFAIPDGYQISDVATEFLSHWQINTRPEGDELVVHLRSPVREDFLLHVSAAAPPVDGESWSVPDFRPLDVAGQISVIGILADIRLQTPGIQADALIPIDHQFLRQAIPNSVFANNISPLAIVAAYYAPQSEYSIALQIDQPDPELIVQSSARLVVADQQLEILGIVSARNAFDSRMGLDLILPAEWRIAEVTGTDGQPLSFERFPTDEKTRIHVAFPTRILADQPSTFHFRAIHTPENWLNTWNKNSISFPQIEVAGATQHSGALAVSLQSDLEVRPQNTAQLTMLDQQEKQAFALSAEDTPLAFAFESLPYQLDLALLRLQPTVSCKSITFFEVRPTVLQVRGELEYEIRQAKTDKLTFVLPASTPDSISIRGHNVSLKDYYGEVEGEHRRWIVQLERPMIGKVQLLLDYQQPQSEEALAVVAMTPVSAVDVEYQTATAVVEGSSDLDIQLQSNGQTLDIGELPESIYQPGRFALGAFAWPSGEPELEARCQRRDVFPLPAAIVQRAEMVTMLGADGKSQTAARFALVTDQPFLRIELPENAELWSAEIDGQPAKPQRRDQALLISLIESDAEQKNDSNVRDVRIVFADDCESLGWLQTVHSRSPRLWLQSAKEDAGVAVPLIDLHWQLVLPAGFQVTATASGFQSPQLAQRRTMLRRMSDWASWLGGGVEERIMFPALAMPMQSASTKSSDRSFAYSDQSGAQGFTPGAKFRRSDDLRIMNELADEVDAESNIQSAIAERELPSEARESETLVELGAVPSTTTATPPLVKAEMWALSGLRGLPIELEATGNAFEFFSLGSQHEIAATIAHESRIRWSGIGIGLLLFAGGVVLRRSSIFARLSYVLVVIFVAFATPLGPAEWSAWDSVAECAVIAMLSVLLFYVVAVIVSRLGRSVAMITTRTAIPVLVLGLCWAAATPGRAQQVVDDLEQFKQLLHELAWEPSATIPADSILIPYDPSDPDSRHTSSQLLLPYDYYEQLVEKANRKNAAAATPAPIDYALTSAEYEARLTLEKDLEISGQLIVDVLNDKAVTIALPFVGGAIAAATVDDQPAKLRFAVQEQGANETADLSTVVLLHLDGAGRKKFEFTFKLPIVRQGGWRSISGRLPVGLTRAINIVSVDEPAEIRLSMDADRRLIDATERQTVQSVLGTDGEINLQWKPSTAQSAIDQSLTAACEAILDVREDGLRLAWQVDLDFRGSQRQSFSLNLPREFLVERVTGENVRGWEVIDNGGQPRLDVSLLSAATDREAFLIELSQRDFVIAQQPTVFDVPFLQVDGAALQNGRYTIRNSPIIELKTLDQTAASRIDDEQTECKIDVQVLSAAASPLGVDHYQCHKFLMTPFQIRLQANRLDYSLTGRTRTILRFGDSEADFETQIEYVVGQRPVHALSFDLPAAWKIERLQAMQNETWHSHVTGDRNRVHISFPSGIRDRATILIDGELTDYTGPNAWSLPAIQLHNVSEQTGQVAVQIDPALSVTSGALVNCESVLVDQLASWLQTEQRSSTRLAFRTRGSDYSAELRFAPIQPRVYAQSISNVRITSNAIEETLLLEFEIQQAGVREFEFWLPEYLRRARIDAPLLREKTISAAPDSHPDWMIVKLNLQDDVIGTYRVVIEHDRQLARQNQIVPIPMIRTGEVTHRFAALQNSGRDELTMHDSDDFEALNPQLSQYAVLQNKLAGGELTTAFLARPDHDNPQLSFDLTQREAVATVAASIEFAKTTMVVDAHGAYRALQNFQVNNRSEQYLDVVLPTDSQLLTVQVAGVAVKPVAWPTAGESQQVRIPLVKTPLGDLDYAIQLKYAGHLGSLATLQEVQFPIIETLNIQVQLSQLHLLLPESHQWTQFTGTMTEVNSQGELQEGFLSYKARQIQQLSQQISEYGIQGNKSMKSRVAGNVKALEKELTTWESDNSRYNNDAALRQQVDHNRRALEEAQKQLAQIEDESESAERLADNRSRLKSLYGEQRSKLSRNLVTKGEKNFRFDAPMPDTAGQLAEDNAPVDGKPGAQEFDADWLSRNALQNQLSLVESEVEAAGMGGAEVRGGRDGDEDADGVVDFVIPLQQQSQLSAANKSVEFAEYGRRFDDAAQAGERNNVDDLFSQSDARPADASRPSAALSERALTSLEIELPERGVSLYFRSPRGNAVVKARAVKQSMLSHGVSMLAVVGMALVFWGGWRIVRILSKSKLLRLSGAAILAVASLSSIATGTLPIFGLCGLLFVVAVLAEKIARRAVRPATAQTA